MTTVKAMSPFILYVRIPVTTDPLNRDLKLKTRHNVRALTVAGFLLLKLRYCEARSA